jgi:hypothetical protein
MRRTLIWLLLCFGCVCGCCTGAASAELSGASETGNLPEEGRYRAYADDVIAFTRISEASLAMSVYADLGTEGFQKLVDASVESPELCIRFLSEKTHTEGQRRIAIRAMYKLSIDQHVSFVRSLAKLRDEALISSEELQYALFPRFSVDTIFDNYEDKRIRLLLGEIEARDDIPPDLKATIRYVRSGDRFAENRIRDFDRECMRWSQMRSIAACVSLAAQILRVYAVSWTTR